MVLTSTYVFFNDQKPGYSQDQNIMVIHGGRVRSHRTHRTPFCSHQHSTCLCLRTENRSRKTHVFEYRDCGVGWGGVGWGGMLTFLVLRTWYIAMLLRSLGLFTATLLRSLVSFTTLHTCCYAAEISGIVYYVTYMLLRCWDLWDRLLRYIHVATLLRSLVSFTTLHTCCYAAEISGIVYYVTYMLLRCWDLWYRLLRYMLLLRSLVSFTTLHTCCYAAEISGIVYYVTYMLLRCWDLWDLWELGNGDAFTRMLTASCLLCMRCSDDAEKQKNHAPSFSRISNHQISTALW